MKKKHEYEVKNESHNRNNFFFSDDVYFQIHIVRLHLDYE